MSVNSLGYLSNLTTDFTNVRAMGDFAVDGVLTVQDFSANSFIGMLSANTVNAESGNTVGFLAALSTNTLTPASGNTITVSNGAAMVVRSVDSGGQVFNVHAFGAVGDGVTNVTVSVQSAIAAASAVSNGVVYFPAGRYVVSGVTVSTNYITFQGVASPANSDGGSVLKSAGTTTVILTVTGNQFTAHNMLFVGHSDINERGEDVSNIGVLLDPSADANIDAVFQNCGTLYCEDGFKLDGRNVRWSNCLFNASKRGVYVPGAVPADSRGIEIYGARFHSIGKTSATSSAAVYVDPDADWQECIISGFDADDCISLFHGFASGLVIGNGTINKARGTGIVLDPTGHALAADRRTVNIGPLSYYQSNGTVVVASGLSTVGTASLPMTVMGLTVSGSGGPGIAISTAIANVHSCLVHNAGQATANTYDAFFVSGARTHIVACAAYQDQLATATNKARYGFNITTSTARAAQLMAFGTFSTATFNNVAPAYFGQQGTAAQPNYSYFVEQGLGFYRSGSSTVAQSYGTLNLATNAVRLSMRTLAASAVTVSAANTNVATNEVVFTIGGASGASICIHSGGTVYIISSDLSAKAT